MSIQANLSKQTQASGRDLETGKIVQAGEWMFLAAAAEATRSSEKTIRRYIKKGTIKSRRLGKQSNSPLQVWITPSLIHTVSEEAITVDGITEIFDIDPNGLMDLEGQHPEAEIAADAEESNQETSAHSTTLDQQMGQVLKAITQQFAETLDKQKEHIFELRKELQQKDTQLKLLPDLEKQAEVERKGSEQRAFEIEALKKQIAALEAERETRTKQSWWQRLLQK